LNLPTHFCPALALTSACACSTFLSARQRVSRGSLPSPLPRIETIVDTSKTCPCTKGLLHRIGENVSERLDIVPAQFRVLVVRRLNTLAERVNDVVQAPAAASLIQVASAVHMFLVSKSADHLPHDSSDEKPWDVAPLSATAQVLHLSFANALTEMTQWAYSSKETGFSLSQHPGKPCAVLADRLRTST
jgi:transposase